LLLRTREGTKGALVTSGNSSESWVRVRGLKATRCLVLNLFLVGLAVVVVVTVVSVVVVVVEVVVVVVVVVVTTGSGWVGSKGTKTC